MTVVCPWLENHKSSACWANVVVHFCFTESLTVNNTWRCFLFYETAGLLQARQHRGRTTHSFSLFKRFLHAHIF